MAQEPTSMSSASYSASTDLFTVTDKSGKTWEMTEESFDEFITKMGTTIEDLGIFRSKLLDGTVVSVRENWNQDYLSMGAFQEVDALSPKFGGFDDAIELQEAYRTVFYPSRAEQLDRVYHGLDTGRVISEDIKTSYLENDGNISADVVSVQNEFDSRGNNITETDVEDVRSENDRGGDMPPTGTEPGTEDQPRVL